MSARRLSELMAAMSGHWGHRPGPRGSIGGSSVPEVLQLLQQARAQACHASTEQAEAADAA